MPDTAVVWSDAEVVLTLGPNEAQDGDIVAFDLYEQFDADVNLDVVVDLFSGTNGALFVNIGGRGQNFSSTGQGPITALDDFIRIDNEYFDRASSENLIALDFDASLDGTSDLAVFFVFNIRTFVSGDEATDLDVAWDGTNYLAIWEENDGFGERQYEMALFDQNGALIDSADGGGGTTSGAVAVNANGQLMAVGVDNNSGGLTYREVNPADGSNAMTTVSFATSLGGSNATISDVEMVSLTNGNFVATYRTVNNASSGNTFRIEAVIIDSSGNLVSGPAQLAIATGNGSNTNFFQVNDPTVVALSSGGFVVAYQDFNFANSGNTTRLLVQRYDNAGVAVGQVLELDEAVTGSFENEVELLELSDGRVQVAWREAQSGVERLVTQIIDYRDEGAFNAAGDYIGTVGADVASVSGENSALLNDGDDVLTYDATGVDANTEDLILDGGDGIDTLNLTSVDGVTFVDDFIGLTADIFFDNAGTAVDIGDVQNFENFVLGDGDDVFSAPAILETARLELDGGRGNDELRLENVNSSNLGVLIEGGIGDDIITGDNGDDDILYGGNVSDTGLLIEATSFFGFAFNMDSDNTSLATAISLDNSFSLFPNANIENATTDPHATIFARGDGSGMHVYRFDVQVAGTIMTLDLDGGRGTDTGSQDLHLWLVDSEGNIIADNDDGPLGSDPGSVSGLDPQLTYLAAEAGTYYIVVSDTFFFDGDPETLSELLSDTSNFVDNGTTYALNVSVDQGDGSDDDTINGLGGDDYIEGGRGADTLDGGDDIDTLGYRQSDAGVIINLEFGLTGGGHATGDTIANFENVDGSNFDDEITGDDDPNVLRGFSGDDELDGLGGDDVIDGGLGADVIDGGAGTNTISFATSDETGVTVLLHTGMGTAGHAAGDTYTNIQNVTGSDFNDFIQGDGNANVLDGGDGNDTLVGRGGADELIGGEGFDTASYFDQAAGVTASLFTGMGAGGDTFTSIERLVGSNFNDVLIGRDGASDTLEGGMGNDTLRGNGGDDTMLGGDGVDLFFSGFGADSHDGGAGTDTVTYNLASAGVIVRLDIGQGFFNQADGDTYTNIENLVGSAFRDALTGTAVANRLEGRAGNDDLFGLAGSDTLLGGNGNDKLDGGTGFDVLTGGLGMDTFVFQAGYQADRITDFTNGDDVLDLTSFGFTSFSQVSALASQQGNDTVINFGNGDAIRLVDFDFADFDANDVMI